MGGREKSDWHELGREIARNMRPHAGFFTWELDERLEMLGVMQSFSEALQFNQKLFFKNWTPRARGEDPPDCEALDLSENRIALELTELVDSESAKKARAGNHYDWRDWRPTFLEELQRILQRKDNGKPKGGPYRNYTLVIYSAEPWLDRSWVEANIKARRFSKTNLITGAYFLMSYDPDMKSCPCFELQIDGC